MVYKKIKPCSKLADFVKCYYCWEHDPKGSQPLIVQSPPSGYEAIVFNYENPYKINIRKKDNILAPSAFYSGQNTTNYNLIISKALGVFGIVFQPAAFATLFRVSVKDTVDKRIALDDIVGNEGKYLTQKILNSANTVERVQIIEQYLLQKLWLSKLHMSVADRAVHLIDSKNGLITIQDLAINIGSSRRSLERDFVEKVGVSPKFYSRLRRISHISYLLMYHKVVWQELVYEGGYYDQSHFIKDFQFFNGRNPEDYLINNKELIRYLDK